MTLMTALRIAELPPLLRFSAAAKAVGVSRSTLDRWVQAGRVRGMRTISPRVRVFDTREFLASLQDDCRK